MKIKKIRNKDEELQLQCKRKRKYTTYAEAFKAMIGTNLRHKTNCEIYTCPYCGLFAVGHKHNALQKEVNTWKRYIGQ